MAALKTLWGWSVSVFVSPVFQPCLWDVHPVCFSNILFRLTRFVSLLAKQSKDLPLSAESPTSERWEKEDAGDKSASHTIKHQFCKDGQAGGKWKHPSVHFLIQAEPNLPASRTPAGVTPAGVTPKVRRAGETPHLATLPKGKTSVWVAWGQTQRGRRDTPRPPSLKGKGRGGWKHRGFHVQTIGGLPGSHS